MPPTPHRCVPKSPDRLLTVVAVPPPTQRHSVAAAQPNQWPLLQVLHEIAAKTCRPGTGAAATPARGGGAKAPVAPLLHGLGPEACVGALAARLHRAAFSAGEVVYGEGDLAAAAFFLSSGTVALHCCPAPTPRKAPNAAVGQQTSLRSSLELAGDEIAGRGDPGTGEVQAGGSFGEPGLFPDVFGSIRPETAVALTDVVVHVLAAEDFAAVMRSVFASCFRTLMPPAGRFNSPGGLCLPLLPLYMHTPLVNPSCHFRVL